MNSADVGAFMTGFGEHVAEVSSSIKVENPLQDEDKPLQKILRLGICCSVR